MSEPTWRACRRSSSAVRINFKFAERKSAIYFMNADVWRRVHPKKAPFLFDSPASLPAPIVPHRDSANSKAAGRLLTGSGESRLEMDIELENGEIGDLVTLVRGQSAGSMD